MAPQDKQKEARESLAAVIADWICETHERAPINWEATMAAIGRLRWLGMRPCDLDCLAPNEDTALRNLLKAINPTDDEHAATKRASEEETRQFVEKHFEQ